LHAGRVKKQKFLKYKEETEASFYLPDRIFKSVIKIIYKKFTVFFILPLRRDEKFYYIHAVVDIIGV